MTISPRVLVSAVLVACIAAVVGCGGDDAGGGIDGGAAPGSPNADAVDEGLTADCSDFWSWREAQDALDSSPDLEDFLDEDLDGIACNDLAQQEYEEAWPDAYSEACEAVFFDSPDGYLYAGDTVYEQVECENSDPGPAQWAGDEYSEPADDGREDA